LINIKLVKHESIYILKTLQIQQNWLVFAKWLFKLQGIKGKNLDQEKHSILALNNK
jgi:hypothetical protein